MNLDLRQGMHAIVTGDTTQEEHEFEVGTEVLLIRWDDYGRAILWSCVHVVDTHAEAHNAALKWVNEADLQPIPVAITSEEVTQAEESIRRSIKARRRPT